MGEKFTLSSLNILQRMMLATEDIATVGKNLEVGYGKNKYKAVSESDVLRAVKPVEGVYGIYSFPYSRRIIDSYVSEKKIEKDGVVTTTPTQFIRIETVYRFCNIDDPSDYIEITTYGDGIDAGDKACGKALTYSDKYALLKAYKIATGEDPDIQESKPGTFSSAQTKKSEQEEKDCESLSYKYQKLSDNDLKALQEKIKKDNVLEEVVLTLCNANTMDDLAYGHLEALNSNWKRVVIPWSQKKAAAYRAAQTNQAEAPAPKTTSKPAE